MTVSGILEAYDQVKKDFVDLAEANQYDPKSAALVERYTLIKKWADKLNEAFKLEAIDTIDAQATFMAHAYVESDEFRKMTEAEVTRYTTEPSQARLDRGSLESQYPAGDARRARIDPGGKGKWDYLGRGPLQVTNQEEYAKTLQYLADQADAQEAAGNGADAIKLRAAHEAISKDPSRAADPEYAFLFSAATMKRAGGDVKAGTVRGGAKTFSGTGPESSWETGSHADPQSEKKQKGYRQARAMLQGAAGAAAGLPAKLLALLSVLESGGSTAATAPEPDVHAVASGS
jgi:predicted chitinase